MTYVPQARIERRAEDRLDEYGRRFGYITEPPVPLELLIERLYELTIDYDEIPEATNEKILGGIIPTNRTILINLKHRDLFEEKPELERSTLGHELGHWEFHVDKGSIGQPRLLEEFAGSTYYRSSVKGDVLLFKGDEGIEDFLAAHRRQDTPHEERAANQFAAALVMPKHLIQAASSSIDLLNWPELYKLAMAFQVSISALVVRLEQLGYIYVSSKTIYRSKEEAHGQLKLF